MTNELPWTFRGLFVLPLVAGVLALALAFVVVRRRRGMLGGLVSAAHALFLVLLAQWNLLGVPG